MKRIISSDFRSKLWYFSVVCMGIAVPSLLVGRAVMFVLLSLGLIAGLGASENLLKTLKSAFASPIAKILGLMLVAFCLSSLNAINPERSFNITFQMACMGLVALGFHSLFGNIPKDKAQFLWRILHFSTIFVAFVCLIDAFFHFSALSEFLHGSKANSVHRLNFMSSILAILLPFVWAYELKNPTSSVLRRYGIAAITLWTVFVCGGRSGWVAMLGSLAVFLFLVWRHTGFKVRWYHALFTLFTLAFGPVLFGLAKGWAVFQERLNLVEEPLGFASGRMGIWQFALDHMSDNPLTGIGLGNFRNLPLPVDGIASNAHPHNFVLQIGLETGILGSIMVAIFLVILTLTLWKNRTSIVGIATGCSVIAFFISSLANTSIFQGWWLILLPFIALMGTHLKKD